VARYERIEGSVQRFWEIEVDGRHLTTRWGRLGRQPQSRTLACADEATALARGDVLVRQKEAKGYRRVGRVLDAERTGSGNPELEELIAADPDDLEARLVYADWLMGQRATLGELIALEVEHARKGDDGLLSAIARLRARCVGELAERRTVQLHWRLGLLRRARLSVRGDGGSLLGQLFTLPAARVLETLRLDVDWSESSLGERGELLANLGRLAPRHLSTLELRYRAPNQETEPFWEGGAWWEPLEGLSALLVATGGASLPLPTERLRVFGFDGQQLGWHPSLLEPWPRLEHLVLERVRPSFVAELANALDAPALRTLALHHADLEAMPWRQLLLGRLGATLRTLELVGPVPWALRDVLDRLEGRVEVRWCGGPAPSSNLRPKAAPWLRTAALPRYSVPW